jgi:hypothetical protein
VRDDRCAVFLNSLRSRLEERRDHSVPVRPGSDSQRNPGHALTGPIDSDRKNPVTRRPLDSERKDSVTRPVIP